MNIPPELSHLVSLLSRMPGVGKKSALRMTFFILAQDEGFADELVAAIQTVKHKLRACEVCFNLTRDSRCAICQDARRDSRIICVVEDAINVVNVESSGEYRGLYHVLQGSLSPIHGRDPSSLRIRELLDRIDAHPVEEVILATNPTVEGEATANYLADLLMERKVKTTRIATGVPMGGSLDYCDSVTMAKALAQRRTL